MAARRGMSYRQILNHYFPGTRLTRVETGRFEHSYFQILPTTVPVMTQIDSLERVSLSRVAAPEFSRGFMVFEKIAQTEFAGHFLSRGATVDPSPAFQSRVGCRTVVSVAAATVDIDRQHQPSLPRLGTDALIVQALKSRAKLTWSLPRPGKMWLHYLLKDHNSLLRGYFPRRRYGHFTIHASFGD